MVTSNHGVSRKVTPQTKYTKGLIGQSKSRFLGHFTRVSRAIHMYECLEPKIRIDMTYM